MLRWLLVLVLLAAGAALAAGAVYVLRDDGPAEFLPDLDQAVPSELAIVQAGDTYRLTFASAVDNVGRGPLLIEGERSGPAEPAMRVRQLVRRTDGTTREREVDGEMRYVESETHAHWHLLDFDRYEVRHAADGTLAGPDEKTGFCLGDRYETDPRTRLEGEPEEPVWTEQCGSDQPGLLSVREGISPGYGDDYVPELEGQYVDVTQVAAGRYVLVHRANPERVLEESDYANNAASVLLQLRRTTGEVPTIRLLARCPDSDRCARRSSRR